MKYYHKVIEVEEKQRKGWWEGCSGGWLDEKLRYGVLQFDGSSWAKKMVVLRTKISGPRLFYTLFVCVFYVRLLVSYVLWWMLWWMLIWLILENRDVAILSLVRVWHVVWLWLKCLVTRICTYSWTSRWPLFCCNGFPLLRCQVVL